MTHARQKMLNLSEHVMVRPLLELGLCLLDIFFPFWIRNFCAAAILSKADSFFQRNIIIEWSSRVV